MKLLMLRWHDTTHQPRKTNRTRTHSQHSENFKSIKIIEAAVLRVVSCNGGEPLEYHTSLPRVIVNFCLPGNGQFKRIPPMQINRQKKKKLHRLIVFANQFYFCFLHSFLAFFVFQFTCLNYFRGNTKMCTTFRTPNTYRQHAWNRPERWYHDWVWVARIFQSIGALFAVSQARYYLHISNKVLFA